MASGAARRAGEGLWASIWRISSNRSSTRFRTGRRSSRASAGSPTPTSIERANRLAHRLVDAGVGPGDFVGLQLVNGPEYLEGMLACFKVRAVPVNINYRYVDAELRYLYADAGLVALIHHRQFAPMVGSALDAMVERRLVLEVDDGSGTPRATWRSTTRPSSPRQPDDRPDGRAVRRRRLLRLHRRHHRRPEGGAVAPRGHLLRGHGRRRPAADRRRHRPAGAAPVAPPRVRHGRAARAAVHARRARTGSRSRPSSAAAASCCCPMATSTPDDDVAPGGRGAGERAGRGRRRHGPAAARRLRSEPGGPRHVVADGPRFGWGDPVAVDQAALGPRAARR